MTLSNLDHIVDNNDASQLQTVLNDISKDDANRLLVEAAKRGHTECLAVLLNIADPQFNNHRAMRRAAECGQAQCLKLLLPHCSNVQDCAYTALRYCASHGYLECLQLLTPYYPNLHDILDLAAEYGHADCVAWLIPLSDPKNNHSLALRSAASGGHNECVTILLPVSDPKAAGSAALVCASYNQDQQMFDLLYDVSDPSTALAHIERKTDIRQDARTAAIAMLTQRMNADEERFVLQKAIETTQHTHAKKKVM